MTNKECKDFLINFNKWRRGEDNNIEMPHPKEIGQAIDYAIDKLDCCDQDYIDALHKELNEKRSIITILKNQLKLKKLQ